MNIKPQKRHANVLLLITKTKKWQIETDFQYLNSVISHVYPDNFDTEERTSDENTRVTGSPREKARSLCKVNA